METVKEKLAALLTESRLKPVRLEGRKLIRPASSVEIADYLIQNGVTIQEWVSVDERLPEEEGKYIVCTAKNTVYCAKYHAKGKFFGTDMHTHITHWMPLPAPPKGVK